MRAREAAPLLQVALSTLARELVAIVITWRNQTGKIARVGGGGGPLFVRVRGRMQTSGGLAQSALEMSLRALKLCIQTARRRTLARLRWQIRRRRRERQLAGSNGPAANISHLSVGL